MPIYCTNFYTNTLSGYNIYANTLSSSNTSNVNIASDLRVNGDVYSSGRMDSATTIFARFRLTSNQSFSASSEIYATSNTFIMDFTNTNMNGMDTMDRVVANSNVYNKNTGVITVPVSGLYYLEMQGSFQNDPGATSAEVRNGVYYKFLNQTNANARNAAVVSASSLVSTNHIAFLLGGDQFRPIYYSNDSNATLLSTNGETYISFTVLSTISPDINNFTRIPSTP